MPNIFNIFLISASIQGLIFSVILLFSKKFNTKSNRYLTYTILTISINNICHWLLNSEIAIILEWKFNKLLYLPWDLLTLPMYFFFAATYLNRKEEISKYYLLPFYFFSSIHLCIISADLLYVDFLENYYNIISLYILSTDYFSILYSVFIIIKIYKLIINLEKNKKEYNFNTVSVKTKWLKQLLFSAIIFFGLSISILLYNTINTNAPINDSFMWAFMSVFVYWLCYAGIYHVGIFNQRTIIREKINEENKSVTINKNIKALKKFNEIDNYIKDNKAYLNPNLTLTLLSQNLNLSEGYISQLINNHSSDNFSSYINALRIEESKKMLTNTDYKNYTIIAIALESGFNSKSAFYTAFKNQTGFSPSGYKKSL